MSEFDSDRSEEETLRASIRDTEEKLKQMKHSLSQKQQTRRRGKESSSPSEYGYVYILLADLTKVCCDYWLAAEGGVLEPSQTKDFPSRKVQKVLLENVPGDEDMENKWKMSTYEPWPREIPKPYAVRVASRQRSDTNEYVSQVGRFLRAAEQDARSSNNRPFYSTFRKHACPLMATPLLGTGYGGNRKNTGEMALQVLPALYKLANELRIDVALVTNDKEVYALMQWARTKMMNDMNPTMRIHHNTINGSRFLHASLDVRINELAHHARHGQLSLFFGAGASMGSNVPNWSGLVDSLAKELELTEDQLKEFSSLDLYTKAAVLEAEVEKREKEKGKEAGASNTDERLTLGHYVAKKLSHARYSIVHSLLAALPVTEAITTNYDDLFEKAWKIHGDFSILPDAPIRRKRVRSDRNRSPKWLLKMHGCVHNPQKIVLTKSHYIRYAERYSALAGIVQSSLLTRHLLFVGFSFEDDNFQRIFDPVRRAKSEEITEDGIESGKDDGAKEESDHCGTALLLKHSALRESLWERDIVMAPMEDVNVDHDPQVPEEELMSSLARKQEIFLDILASRCSLNVRMEFLMNSKFEKALSDPELQLKQAVRQFEDSLERLPAESRQNVAFRRIIDTLHSLGSTVCSHGLYYE